MKVTLKIDSELLPVVIKALREYTERSIVDLADAPKPAPSAKPVVLKPTKRRGRPPGKKEAVAVAVAAPAAVATM